MSFDDGSIGKLLAKYVYEDKVSACATQFAIAALGTSTRHIVDFGCGIGWSSWEIAQHCSGSTVVGLDKNLVAIEIARMLFPDARLKFSLQNACTSQVPDNELFDAAILLGHYEHIPREQRSEFHSLLGRILRPDATVILTCPSLTLQRCRRKERFEDLEVVDEDVTADDVKRLAEDLRGGLVCLRHVSVTENQEYIHAIVARNHATSAGAELTHVQIPSEHGSDRADRVRKRLGIRVGRAGMVLPIRQAPVIVIVGTNEDAVSETFIRAQAEQLPFNVRYLAGKPLKDDTGKPLLNQSTASRAVRKIASRLCHLPCDFFETQALTGFLRRQGAAAVLAEHGPTAVACMEACRQSRIPLIAHFYGFDAYGDIMIRRFGNVYRQLFAQAAAIVVVSHDMKERLESLGANPSKVLYNPCGADLKLFHGANVSKNPPLFIATGRFIEKKAPHLTILAFSEVVKNVPEARLVMVGDGPLFGACQHLVNGSGLRDSVKLLGTKRHELLPELMRQGRAFVQHSVRAGNGDAEGTPVAVLEAQASGLPVVATRHMGIVEAVVHNKTGFLVDECDVKGMAQYMLRLATDPALAGEMGQRARYHVEAHFSLQSSIAQLATIIEKSIEQGHG
jgi:colanic acid/amylovoran biosynthesis glycosyltransferase